MQKVFKALLFLGCISMVGLPTQPLQAASRSAAPAKDQHPSISDVMNNHFGGDKSPSPFKGTPQTSPEAQLTNTLVQFIRTGNEQQLNNLFYNPDFKTWSNVYKQVKQKDCTTVELITFLDKTKTDLLTACKDKQASGTPNAYFYIPALLDNALQQIFEGCWGISDAAVGQDVVQRLKHVYGRIVSAKLEKGELVGNLTAPLESKKTTNKAHYEALQEWAIAVHLQKNSAKRNPATDWSAAKQIVKTLSNEQSFKKALQDARYQESWGKTPPTDPRVLGDILNPTQASITAKQPSQSTQPEQDKGKGLKTATPQPAPAAPKDVDKVTPLLALNPTTQVDDVLKNINDLADDQSQVGKISSDQQTQLLNLFSQAVETKTKDIQSKKDEEQIKLWRQLAEKAKATQVFALNSLISYKAIQTFHDDIALFTPTVSTTPGHIGMHIQQWLKAVSDLIPNKQEQQVVMVNLELLLKHYKLDDHVYLYDFWRHLLTLENGQIVILPTQRDAIRERGIQSLENLLSKKGVADLKTVVSSFSLRLTQQEKADFKAAVTNKTLFQSLSDKDRQEVIKRCS